MSFLKALDLKQTMAKLPLLAAALAALVSLAALVGWATGIEELRAAAFGGVSMNPATAIAAVLAATSLTLQVQTRGIANLIGRGCAIVVSLLGVLVLAGYFFSWEAGPDRLLFRDSLNGNRMAPNTAIVLVLIGSALAFLNRTVSQFLAIVALGICGFGIVGYTFGVTALYGIASFIPMAVNTAIVYGALAAGILAARPQLGAFALLQAPGAGGSLVRRLAPAAVAVPWGLGWFRLVGERNQLFSPEIGVALMVVMTIAFFLALIWIVGASLEKADSDRHRAEAALRKSTQEIQDLYHHSPCGYHSVGPDGILVNINQTESRWLGYAADELIGRRRFVDLVHPSDRERYFAEFARVRELGATSDVELNLLRRDGGTFPVLLNSSAIRDADGKYLRSRTTLTDLTERKRAEEAIKRLNEELEIRVAERTSELAVANRDLLQTNEENEMFVYSVSHDLRSPLVNLLGFSKELNLSCTELSRIIADPRVPKDVQAAAERTIDCDIADSLHYIENSVRRLSSIIDSLLRLSRAGRVRYLQQPVDLAVVVARIVAALHGTISQRNAEVVVHALPVVVGDADALDHTFANLIGNALNYLDPTRQGRVEVGFESISGDASKSVRVYVRDNGQGIPEGSRDKVFRAFQRIHPNSAPGEGMGLAIVYRTIKRHGGRIWFESELGRGTTFYVEFAEHALQESLVGEHADQVLSSTEPEVVLAD